MKRILIIGTSGGLASIAIKLLLKKYPTAEILGVDSRAVAHLEKYERVSYKTIRYTPSHFESLFRENTFDVIIQLGRLSHKQVYGADALSHRLSVNLIGTKTILDLSLKFKVKKVVLLSSYHVYGALSDNPTFINEDHPLRGSIKFLDLRDVIEMDQMASNWMWKNQKHIETTILRPCTIIGPQINNFMMKYLLTPHAPTCSDFNPMFQFVHEFDMANIICESIDGLPTGVFNVAPDECISLQTAKDVLDISMTKLPSFVLSAAAKMTNKMWLFPEYMLSYIKYSCIIDNQLLKSSFPHEEKLFKYSTRDALTLSKLN